MFKFFAITDHGKPIRENSAADIAYHSTRLPQGIGTVQNRWSTLTRIVARQTLWHFTSPPPKCANALCSAACILDLWLQIHEWSTIRPHQIRCQEPKWPLPLTIIVERAPRSPQRTPALAYGKICKAKLTAARSEQVLPTTKERVGVWRPYSQVAIKHPAIDPHSTAQTRSDFARPLGKSCQILLSAA